MSSSINFLRQRQRELTTAVVSDRKYVRWMSYILGIVVTVAAVIFGFDFFLQRSIDRVEAENTQVSAELQQHAEIESLYLQLAEKVGEIDKILTGRIEKRLVLQFFTSLFLTDELSLNEIAFESSDVLQFTLVSTNVFTLEKALDELESPEVQNRFVSLSTTDLVRTDDGKYSMKVSVGIKKQPEPAVASPSALPQQ